MITKKSPYIVRVSITLPQSAAPMAEWRLKNGIKKVDTVVADYGPGIDAEKWFSETFKGGGGDRAANPHAAEKPRFRAVHPTRQGRQAGSGVPLRALRVGAAFMKGYDERASTSRASS